MTVAAAARHRRDEVDGWPVAARVWDGAPSSEASSRPPIVLVHGLGVASRMCRPVAERLAGRFTVLAPDLPGFGRSGGPDRALGVAGLGRSLHRWMAAIDLPPALLVGTSLGAQVVAEAARLTPSRATAVVLASPIVDADRRSWPRQLGRWQLEQATQSRRLRSLLLQDYAACGIGRVVGTFRHALHHRIEDTVAQLPGPVAVCWGTRDPLLSRRWVERLAATAPRGELRVLPGVEHAMCHERPLELSRVVTHVADHGGVEAHGAGDGAAGGRVTPDRAAAGGDVAGRAGPPPFAIQAGGW